MCYLAYKIRKVGIMCKIRDAIKRLKNNAIIVILVVAIYLISLDVALFFININLGKLTKQVEKIQTSISSLNKK